MLQNVIPAAYPGIPGDVVKWSNGFTYKKAKNGKWGLVCTFALKRKVARLYKQSTLRQVAKEIGISMSTVQSIVNEMGASKGKAALIHFHKETAKTNRKEIIRLYTKEHKSAQEISEIFGFADYTYVKAVLKENNIAQRPVQERTLLGAEKARHRGTSWFVRENQRCLSKVFRSSFASKEAYFEAVRRTTSSVLCNWSDVVDPKNLRSYTHHIDHQFSLFDGWSVYSSAKNKYVKRKPAVPLYVMCHPANLKLLPCKTNMQKHSTSHLSLDELLRKIKQFEKKYGKVFVQ